MLIYRKHNGNGNVKLFKYKFVKFILSPMVNILIIAHQISTLPVQDINGVHTKRLENSTSKIRHGRHRFKKIIRITYHFLG